MPIPEYLNHSKIILNNWFWIILSDEGLTLEASAIVSFTASITLINTQLIHQFVSFTASITLINTQLMHQFVFRRADAVA